MKIYCVKKSHFEKVIGYGLWSLLTLGLFSLIPLVQYETSTFILKPGEWQSDGMYCYNPYLDKSNQHCVYVSSTSPVFVYVKWGMFLVANIINFIVIGIWIYSKQNAFRVEFCKESLPTETEKTTDSAADEIDKSGLQ